VLGWNQYFSTIDQQVASFNVNLDAGNESQRQSLPQLCLLTITLLQPEETGLSAPKEDRDLFRIESMLENETEEHLYGIYVGRSTIDGKRTFACYIPTGIPAELILNGLMANFEAYDYELDLQPDEEWSYFEDFLYPEGENLQRIVNRKVLEELRESGEDLNQLFSLEHEIHFANLDGMLDCKNELAELGFEIINAFSGEYAENEMPYRLYFTRDENLADSDFDDRIIAILHKAETYGGTYIGWETEVDSR